MKVRQLFAAFWMLMVLTALCSVVEGKPLGTAQDSGHVAGTVLTWDDRVVVHARVTLIHLHGRVKRQVHTDAEGRFSFSELPPGEYTLRVELEGFTSVSHTIVVMPGQTTSLNVSLTLAPLTDTMTVTATLAEQRLGDIPTMISVLTRDEIKRSAGLTLDDVLKQVPSFSLFRRTSSLVSQPTTQGVSLRGIGASGASRTVVLLDGVPHNDPFGNWVYWSKIPQSQIESIEIADGGLSSLYGSSAMAGVINIITRRPQRRTFTLKAQGGTLKTGDLDLAASHTFGPLAVSVGGRLFRTDGYHLIRAQERGPVDIKANSRHQMGHWRVQYTPLPNLTIFHDGRFFNENRDNGTRLQTNASRETYLGGGLRATTSDGSQWQATLYSHISTFKAGFSAIVPARASESLTLLQDVPYRDVGGTVQWFPRLADKHRLTIGADTRWIKAESKEDVFTNNVNSRDRIIRGKQLYVGFFAHDFMRLHQRFVLTLGARIDYWRNFEASRQEIVTLTEAQTVTPFPDTSEITVTPRAGILYHITDHLAVRGAFYQGFRAPTLNELYRPFRVGNVNTEGNPDLGPERLTGGEVGFNHIITRSLLWRVTGFWNRVKDPISNVTISVTPALITRQRQNLGRARVRGIDAECQYRFTSQWNLRAHYLFSEATVEQFPADRTLEGKFLQQVPRHRAVMALDYLNPRIVNLRLQARFDGLRFDDDLNGFKLGSFLVADLTASRSLGECCELFLAIENLFDRQYAVQATPVQALGTPRLLSGGIRLHLFPQ